MICISEEWRWLNNITLKNSGEKQLNLSKVWPKAESYLGKCGSIVVMEDDEIYLRSSSCEATSTRFICTYSK